ncbi:MAG: Gfo/Idh/MocA family oxidoreductase, partial [Trueperaceae bacterium]
MNLAVIGHGAMGGEHVEAMLEIGGVTPYVVAGPDEAAVAAFASRYGFERHTTDPMEAIVDAGVDVVVIASPNDAHALQARAAIESGKHVLVEIPVAMRWSEAEAMANLAMASNQVVMAAHTSRFYPAVQRLVAAVRAGDLRPHHVVSSMGTNKRRNLNWKGEQRDWVDDLLWHHGMHVVDTILQLFEGSAVEEAFAHAGARHPLHGGVMDVSASLRFASGGLATVGLSYHAQHQFTRYLIVAEESFVDLAQDAPGAGRTDLTEGHPFRDLVKAQDGEFLEACKEGGPSPVSIASVLPAMRVVDRLHQQISSAAVNHAAIPVP